MPELTYPFRTRDAMHTLRLGYQGRELLRRAGSACRSEEGRRRVFPVRKGEVEFNDVLTGIGEPERTLEDLRETAWLPPEPTTVKSAPFW